MDFHQIKIFLEVARQKNFTRAAENLFLSQPTVSLHVKNLEEAVGAPLLLRTKEGLKLTDAGEILFCYGQQLLDARAKALLAIQDQSQAVQGHLELAASSVPGAYLLPQLLKSFCQENPQVTFSLLLRDTRQVLQSISDYTYDLGFTGEPGPRKGLEIIKLAENELILIAAPQTEIPSTEKMSTALPEISLKECSKLPFLLREPGSATRMVFEKALKESKAKINLSVIGYLEGQEAVKEAVKTGLGVTVISRKAVEDELKAGLLKGYKLKGMPLKRTFYLIYRQQSVFSPLNKAFFNFTLDYFKEANCMAER